MRELSTGAVPRRALLIAVAGIPALGFAAACSNSEPAPVQTTAQLPTETSDPVSEAIADEWLLVSRYESTIARHPTLADRLSPFRDQHVAHAKALGGARPDSLAELGPVPKSPTRAMALLAAAEQAARGLRIDGCLRCNDSDTARLLALIAASESSHATALEGATP